MYGRFNKRGLKCDVCGRTFNEHSSDSCCPECFEIAGWDNQVNDDGGEPLTAAANRMLGQLLAAVAKKGGDVERVKSMNDYLNWTAVEEAFQPRSGKSHNDSRPRIGVTVNGQSFLSTQGAFRQNLLPMNQLHAVRAALKATGKAQVEHKGKVFKFKTLKQ